MSCYDVTLKPNDGKFSRDTTPNQLGYCRRIGGLLLLVEVAGDLLLVAAQWGFLAFAGALECVQ